MSTSPGCSHKLGGFTAVNRTPVISRIAVVVALALALMLVPGALAGKGGPKGGGTGSGASIAFDSTYVTVGQTYRVNGSGFRPNTWVTVGAYYADTTWWNSQVSDAAGNISLSFTATSAGQVRHDAKQQGANGRLRLLASATLTVGPAA